MAMSEAEVKTLVGLTLDEAQKRVADKGSYVTIASEDGKSFPVSAMYDINRVCIHLEKGKITAADIG